MAPDRSRVAASPCTRYRAPTATSTARRPLVGLNTALPNNLPRIPRGTLELPGRRSLGPISGTRRGFSRPTRLPVTSAGDLTIGAGAVVQLGHTVRRARQHHDPPATCRPISATAARRRRSPTSSPRATHSAPTFVVAPTSLRRCNYRVVRHPSQAFFKADVLNLFDQLGRVSSAASTTSTIEAAACTPIEASSACRLQPRRDPPPRPVPFEDRASAVVVLRAWRAGASPAPMPGGDRDREQEAGSTRTSGVDVERGRARLTTRVSTGSEPERRSAAPLRRASEPEREAFGDAAAGRCGRATRRAPCRTPSSRAPRDAAAPAAGWPR